ncbi:MAG: bifunctional (p)ppGpp synthetase/guanosine-3',5'-bis(diphosphate) 3'-pyrophosphohydrolase [Clostridia bacterium]|nr:bifunctional (p)ppGpp synthetase/guanosine-3',5'-bis(diphosphate) 3'-pyrophosphohydrolase [Clostridia bacterium]
MYEEIRELLALLERNGKKYDLEKINKAFLYARELHEGQFRLSGEPYISHPIAVAEIVASLELDTDSVCAALLHDTVEDCSDRTDLSAIKKEFGASVAELVDGLTKIEQMKVEDKEEAHIENIRKMLLAMSRDIRVIFIKLCDRLHNMRTLSAKREERRRDIALETMHVYAPLAHRLGMQRIKHELENLSLQHLDPIGYDEVLKEVESRYGQSLNLIDNAKQRISERLSENQIPCVIEGRVKSIYSLYRKMYNQNKSLDEIYDFYALRVIVDSELACYTVLGLIHESFRSVPGRFKDYISTPKPNMYQSLHTTVIGRDGIPFEVQIRTHEMHRIAEFGVAAHWKYKTGETATKSIDEKLNWISKLLEADDSTKDPDEFIHSFKTDIFNDETFVFTPKGDVISLPFGSTVIDFAYAIHSAVGNKMIGAKINGVIVPIDRVPQNGEIVEILTSSASRGPSRDWLKIVKTGEARNKIRAWFKHEKRAENIEVGREEIERELRRLGRSYTVAQQEEIIENLARRIGIQGADDLYNTIGFGGLTVSKISGKLKDEFEKVVKTLEENTAAAGPIPQIKIAEKPKAVHSRNGIVVDGADGCLVKFAKCCNPLPGDSVIGFITRGYGISIHKYDCPNAKAGILDPAQRDRWIEAHWDESDVAGGEELYEATLQIFTHDGIGVLASISTALADMRVSITQINSQKHVNGSFLISLTVACKNVNHFKSIVARLKNISAVESVTRGLSRI